MFLLETQQPLNQPTNEPISIHFYPTRVKATKRDKKEKKSQPGSIEANLRAKTSTSINSVFGRKQTNKPFFRAVCLQIYKCSRPITIKPILLPPLFKIQKPLVAKWTDPTAERLSCRFHARPIYGLHLSLSLSLENDKSKQGKWTRWRDTRPKDRWWSVTVEHLITSVKRSRLNSGYELTNPLSETTLCPWSSLFPPHHVPPKPTWPPMLYTV